MERQVHRKLDELRWSLAGVLLFFGIASPALHRIFK
ncbi:MAG: hypothetical protein ACFWUL_08275 [Dialister sp.]|jgi:hypothetical protein